jgi:hypothetical protein
MVDSVFGTMKDGGNATQFSARMSPHVMGVQDIFGRRTGFQNVFGEAFEQPIHERSERKKRG